MTTAAETIQSDITDNSVVLYMKGTSQAPQCGFSSKVAGILNYMGVEYKDVNVLADEAFAKALKISRIGRQFHSFTSKVNSWVVAISSSR